MASTVLTIGRVKVHVDDVNHMAAEDSENLFKLCNEKYEKKISMIAHRIAKDPSKARLIMLSGPSASGKTTTSLKLESELEKLGCRAVTISMDDFFKNREDAPTAPDGTKDYETVAALDQELLKTTLGELITTGHTRLPIFNFKTGQRAAETKEVVLGAGDVAVVEGLHALDTVITGLFPQEAILKLYVSVSSDYIADTGDIILCARDVRLIRRAMRDFQFRGTDVESTLDMWDSVCRGEDLYVRPFKKYADITVNSAFSCEPCIFREETLKLFGSVGKDSRHAQRVSHIIEGIKYFVPISPSIVPGNCVLREFLGGSDYYSDN
jgi:uridine kinase